MYTEKVLDHFRNPRNQGFLDSADAIGQKGNPVCGDVMKIYLKIEKDENSGEDFVEDVKFETLGCAAAIAVSSILSEKVKGKSLANAGKITKNEIIQEAGGLPPNKMHCSMLAVDALQNAIKNYK
ncbi:MAG: iron-sulfur cluster assembly scaffold protein [Patescibacteria group bacterium]|jgi:nitrogen fixation NifU-like protein|nr:iron-sulfur cluster assembly scaffold protein [Patescibacteria group bacterium]